MADDQPDPTATRRLLRAIGAGEAGAAELLFPVVYDELHRLAGRLMGSERSDHTLQPTALVNEAYLRLCAPGADYQDRGHFLRTAAKAMRHVLVDHARARGAQKRRSGARADVDADSLPGLDDGQQVLAIDEVLARLAALDPQLAQLVELRFFAGLDNPTTAEALGISLRSVERGWRTARAFLVRELEPDGGGPPPQP